MTISKVSTLVSTHWLKKQICNIPKLGSALRVIDTSWIPKGEADVDGYMEFYRRGHIASSMFFDIEETFPDIDKSKIAHPFPDPNFFQEYVETFGITNNTHVIAYDSVDNRPSVRAWFTFKLFGHDKVSILNGGLRKWVSDGYHTTTEEPDVENSTYKASFRPELLRNYEDIVKITKTQSTQLMDARGPKGFHGRIEESSGGHISGSKNIPMSTLFNEDGTFKSEEDLEKVFADAGIDLSKPVVSTCLGGITACSLIAAANILGKEGIPLYNGAFREWRAKSDPSDIARTGTK